ncbi:MAG: hypothetical protein ABI606_18570 [Rhodoferax sp.]
MKLGLAGKVIALSLALGSTVALACGYCVEDRIAAVYDHALAQRTLALKHEIVFFAWDGPLTRSDASKQKMMALGEAVPGVDKGSTRVSIEPAAIALAFDPQRSSAQAIEAALQKKLSLMKLSIERLQTPQAPAILPSH